MVNLSLRNIGKHWRVEGDKNKAINMHQDILFQKSGLGLNKRSNGTHALVCVLWITWSFRAGSDASCRSSPRYHCCVTSSYPGTKGSYPPWSCKRFLLSFSCRRWRKLPMLGSQIRSFSVPNFWHLSHAQSTTSSFFLQRPEILHKETSKLKLGQVLPPRQVQRRSE